MTNATKLARTGYTYRRISVALMVFLPIWAAYVLIAQLPILVSLIAIAVGWLPTLVIIATLLTVADSHLEAARHEFKGR